MNLIGSLHHPTLYLLLIGFFRLLETVSDNIMQEYLSKILLTEIKKITNPDGQEKTIKNFSYQEVIDLLQKNSVTTPDVVNSLCALLTAHLAIGVAKLTSLGGIGESVDVVLDNEKIKATIELLKGVVELQKEMRE